MAQFEIRLASPDDASLILLMVREFYELFEDLHFDAIRTADAVNTLLANEESGLVLVGLLDANPIGYLAVVFSHSIELFGRVAWIDEFYIRHEHRSQGLGTAMLKHAEDRCRANGVKSMLLELDKVNDQGRELYSRSGFAVRSQYQTYVKAL
jgi:GNAT superfamily N-acetyltransferase